MVPTMSAISPIVTILETDGEHLAMFGIDLGEDAVTVCGESDDRVVSVGRVSLSQDEILDFEAIDAAIQRGKLQDTDSFPPVVAAHPKP